MSLFIARKDILLENMKINQLLEKILACIMLQNWQFKPVKLLVVTKSD